MKTKSKPERRQKKPVHAAREPTGIPPASRAFPVIAMAASVGGLKALSVILGGLPADFPAAIAIVMHLSPDHKSILAEILHRRTHLAVKQAHTGDLLCRSSVFIAPPNHHLFVVKGGRLRLSSSVSEKVHHARPSAEPLFASVAEVYKKNAIAVVLTGGDGDGSFGVQIVKDKGGQVIAQDRPTSENFSMPETSIKTGDVDFILPLDEIAPKLIELVERGVQSLCEKHPNPPSSSSSSSSSSSLSSSSSSSKTFAKSRTRTRARTRTNRAGGFFTQALHAASPSAGPKPSELAAPAGDRGLKRPKGRAPARRTQAHLPATPRISAGTKAAMIPRRK